MSGVKYPNLAASACAFWVVSRVLYTIGYTTGDAAKVRCSSRDMNFGWHSRILGQRNRLRRHSWGAPLLGCVFLLEIVLEELTFVGYTPGLILGSTFVAYQLFVGV